MTPKQRNGIVAAVIAVVLVAIVGIGWAIQSNRDTTGDSADRPGQSASDGASVEKEAVDAAADGDYGLGVGDPDAPVTVEIFEDFQCPHCADFESASQDQLMAAAADGSAYVVYRPMAFLNEWSVRAMSAFGVVLDAAGGTTALEFHDLLFANQPSGTMPTDDEIVDLAVQAGATEADVRTGIEKLSFQQWVVNATDDASKRGVTSTPTVFVNDKQVPGQTIDQLVENTMRGITAG